ncbi:efflux RND transporter periplasmic adaptor subunit [uncultured Coprobacter sp.]|jgi:efflux transporter, RND family, MFP subunit|uniref:efflux RND transporter periplasmic adaptor subunit n=1 Tax=uncultured Coprobacter sp. TaxID=1720550 RepID=UPI0025D31135|nr:efflux RND transporter periplasmic adaptor subunit [uncultured Coprobacter sp.]
MKGKSSIFHILLLFVLFSCSGKKITEKSPSSEIISDSLQEIISIDTVQIYKISDELTLNGRVTLDPKQTARVFPIFGGTITEINAEIGDYVKKGNTLAIIRSGEAADYEKQLKDAVENVKTAQRNLQATEDMFHSGMTSEKDVMIARQELTNAHNERQRLQEIFSIYHIQPNSFYQIKAPVTGFIIDKNISKGMQIRNDQDEDLFTISGLNDVWIIADIYESDINKIHENDSVRITTLAYPDKEFTGIIEKISHILDPESKTMNARIELKNIDHILKPGMFTNIHVQSTLFEKSMPRIDTQALIFENGKNYVIAITPDNRTKIKEIEIYKQSGKYCYLSSGLNEGEKIITQNALLVYNALKAN